jgi:uncharacterized repeat protein (TIGR04076 family)
MSLEMATCRITVLRRMVHQDLADEYLDIKGDYGACDRFSEGQEIIVAHPFTMPEGFCPWAWADIRGDLMMIAAGGDLPWMKQRGTAITGCTDWFRPVIFKIERVE